MRADLRRMVREPRPRAAWPGVAVGLVYLLLGGMYLDRQPGQHMLGFGWIAAGIVVIVLAVRLRLRNGTWRKHPIFPEDGSWLDRWSDRLS